MINEFEFEKWIRGKTIEIAHISNSHGDVVQLIFTDGTQLDIWCRDDPADLHAALFSNATHAKLSDFGSRGK